MKGKAYAYISAVVFVVLAMSENVFADDYYKKFIEKHDVDAETMSIRSDNPNDFWESMVENKMSLQDFVRDMGKQKGAEKEAQRRVGNMEKFDIKYRPEVAEGLQSLCDSIFSAVGSNGIIEFCFVMDPTVNAFSTYSSDGMAIGINTGVLAAKGMTYEALIGIGAHEYAHASLFHILQQCYADAKRKRRDDIIKGVSGGLAAVSQVTETYTNAVLGIEPTIGVDEEYQKNYCNIEESYHEDLKKYHYSYSREQELEADLVAYRFLEWVGLGGQNYIEALKIMASNNPESYYAEEDSTHPSMNERIAFLTYVASHPEIGNTDNNARKKKNDRKEKIMEFNQDYFDPLY